MTGTISDVTDLNNIRNQVNELAANAILQNHQSVNVFNTSME